MASRKSITIYILKYFMAVRNCVDILVLYELEAYVSVDLLVYRRTT